MRCAAFALDGQPLVLLCDTRTNVTEGCAERNTSIAAGGFDVLGRPWRSPVALVRQDRFSKGLLSLVNAPAKGFSFQPKSYALPEDVGVGSARKTSPAQTRAVGLQASFGGLINPSCERAERKRLHQKSPVNFLRAPFTLLSHAARPLSSWPDTAAPRPG